MKFKQNDLVYHKSKDKNGKVIIGFNTESGPRYYIKHSKFVWSVPEKYLTLVESKKTENKNEENQ